MKNKAYNKAHNHKWTAAETEKLRKLYPTHKNVEIAKMLGVNINVLAYKIKLMGLKNSNSWTDEQVARLWELYPTHTKAEIAKMLGVSVSAIRYQAKLLCFKKRLMSYRMAQLRELYPTHKNAEIAEMLGVSVSAIKHKIKNRGLRKAPEHKARINKERIDRLYSSDKVIAWLLTGSGKNKEMLEELLKHKDVIELKRSLLLLNRAIKEAKQKEQKTA
jgi:predicted transcriptional regulator